MKVLIADDHPIVREGLRTALSAEGDITIVGEASDGLEALSKAMELRPDVVIMDIYMPHNEDFRALVSIKQFVPGTKVLILSVSDQKEDLLAAIKHGTDGYLPKQVSIREVTNAVRRAFNGEVTLTPNIAAWLVDEFRGKQRQPQLSQREIEVLQLVGEGLDTAEIAGRISLSQSTVYSYIRRVMEKLHLRNQREVIAYAVRTRGKHNPLNRPS